MKKIICILVTFVLVMSLAAGCNKSEKGSSREEITKPQEEQVLEVAEMEQFQQPKKGETIAEIIVADYGSIFVRLFASEAPKAVENFTTHAKNGYYDGVSFHRILKDFMIQGGDPTGTGRGGESIWGESFEDEFSDTLQPYRGALCMANAGPNTNGSQFFLVQSGETYDNQVLNQVATQYKVEFDAQSRKAYSEVGGTPWLYQMHTVFGQIYEGYEVLDAIANVEMADANSGRPAKEVIIETVKISIFE